MPQDDQPLRMHAGANSHSLRLGMARIDSNSFRELFAPLGADYADYASFLMLTQRLRVETGSNQMAAHIHVLDVSDAATLSPGTKAIKLQREFCWGNWFSGTLGYSFVRAWKGEPALRAYYQFPDPSRFTVACKVQHDVGDDRTLSGEVVVQ